MKKLKLPSGRIKIKSGRSLAWFYVVLTIVVFAMGIWLYLNNPTFQKNIEVAFSYFIHGSSEIKGPVVSEKDGQAFILYDHPLVNVTIVKDSECKGTRCDFPNLAMEISQQITPLLKIKEVDYRSNAGVEILKNIKWQMLPVVIFDKTLEKVRGFDQLKELFLQDGDVYLLRLQPSTTRILPEYGNALMKGFVNKNYPIKIVEYGNYSSYYTARSQEAIDKLLVKYPDDIVIYFKHFVKSQNDIILARASECAAMQGKFWEMHKALFDNLEVFFSLKEDQYAAKLLELAYKIYLPDQVSFRECMKTNVFDSKIQSQLSEAEKIGIDSAPVFFINDAVIPGAMDFSEFDAVVRSKLGLPQE